MNSFDLILRHRALPRFPQETRHFGTGDPLDKGSGPDYWKPATKPYALSGCFEKSANVKLSVADC